VARLLAEVYESPPPMVAWELDPRVLEACRLGMGLEEVTAAAGIRNVELGSPLDAAAAVPGGFSAIMVDLFVEGRLLPALMDPDAWRAVRRRLSDPGRGRVMAHLGPAAAGDGSLVPQTVLALNAMAEAFDGGRRRAGPRGAGAGGRRRRRRARPMRWADCGAWDRGAVALDRGAPRGGRARSGRARRAASRRAGRCDRWGSR
jgi:hypothetical protein